MIHIEWAHDTAPGCHCVYVTSSLNPISWSCSRRKWCFSAWDVAVFVPRTRACLCAPLCGSCQQSPPTLRMNRTPGVSWPLAASGVARCPLKSEADCLWKIISDNHTGPSLALHKVSLKWKAALLGRVVVKSIKRLRPFSPKLIWQRDNLKDYLSYYKIELTFRRCWF